MSRTIHRLERYYLIERHNLSIAPRKKPSQATVISANQGSPPALAEIVFPLPAADWLSSVQQASGWPSAFYQQANLTELLFVEPGWHQRSCPDASTQYPGHRKAAHLGGKLRCCTQLVGSDIVIPSFDCRLRFRNVAWRLDGEKRHRRHPQDTLVIGIPRCPLSMRPVSLT